MGTKARALLLGLLIIPVAACGADSPASSDLPPPALPDVLRIATTTSTQDSGLLDAILPLLDRDCHVATKVIAVGTGQALRLGADGEVDLLLTHDPEGEAAAVASGAASVRRPLMYNDFVIVGPASDPAGIRGLKDAREAFRRIDAALTPWLSRGDDSGTHRMERRLLSGAGLPAEPAWLRSVGQGMGTTLAMAREAGACTLADRATWASHRVRTELPILVEGDPALRNPYAVLLVNPAKHPGIAADAARRAADWLAGPKGRAAIEAFRKDGRQLFFLLPGP
jgi:tungstate transport system substrate-binding protein